MGEAELDPNRGFAEVEVMLVPNMTKGTKVRRPTGSVRIAMYWEPLPGVQIPPEYAEMSNSRQVTGEYAVTK